MRILLIFTMISLSISTSTSTETNSELSTESMAPLIIQNQLDYLINTLEVTDLGALYQLWVNCKSL